MLAESQEFNDNTGNENTDLCFHCVKYKTIDEFDTPEGKSICKECVKEFEKLCKKRGVKFVEEKRNQEHYSHYYGCVIDHIDVYAVIGEEKVFIRGYADHKKDPHDLAEIFNIKFDFLENGLKYLRFHCGAGWAGDKGKLISPIEFLNWIKENEYNFGVNYDCEVEYLEHYKLYNFHGNLQEISCAFHFRIYDEDYLKEFVEILKDPYFKNIELKGGILNSDGTN